MASIEILKSLEGDETPDVGADFGFVGLKLVDEDPKDNTYIEVAGIRLSNVDPALSEFFSYSFSDNSIDFKTIKPLDFDDPNSPNSFSFTVTFDVDKVIVRNGVPTYSDYKTITKTYDLKVLDVNDEAPRDFRLIGDGIDETATGGKTAGVLSAIDPDRGDTPVYRLVDDPSGKFELVGNRILLKSGATLDFESRSSYDIVASATDAEGRSLTQTFTINVNDVAEGPTEIRLDNATISELAKAGDVVGTLSALDPDSDPRGITYQIMGKSPFAVENGQLVYAGDLKINFEMKPFYDVKIMATDAEGARLTQFLKVSLIDEVEWKGSGDNDIYSGDGSGEQIYSYGGEDTIAGGGGNDTIFGGLGIDRLTGGSGADVFFYSTNPQFGDVITDFQSGEDKFRFDLKFANKTGIDRATLFVNEDVTGNGPSLSYRTDTGQLIYDVDGAGKKQGLLIATLLDAAELASGNQIGIAGLTMDDFEFKVL